MKIVAKKSELLGALKRVNLIKNGQTLPILDCVLVEADENGNARVVRTNLDVRISAGFKAESASKGAVCLPAKTLQGIVEHLEKEITMETEEKRLMLRDESKVFNMSTFPVDDFPEESEAKGGFKSFDIGCLTLLKALRATSHNCSTDDSRKMLNGIHFKKEDNLIIEATDGKSASRYEPESKILGLYDFILAKKCGVIELLASVDIPEDPEDPEPQCIVKVWKNAVEVELEQTQLRTKLIEGTYPSIDKVIPEEFDFTCYVSKQSLINAIKSATAIEPAYITMELKEASIKILSTSNLGDYFEYLEAEYSEKELSICFNPDFILSGLAQIGPNIKISLKDGMFPVLFESDKYKFVAMPLRDGSN